MTLVLCGIKYSFATACNVLLSFCFCLKSWCFCLQGTRHTFHAQKAREKEKVSQKMWKNWTTWSSNQHNRSENKKWAEPMGQQSVTPKKAKRPNIWQDACLRSSPQTPNSKTTDYSLSISQQHRCSTEMKGELDPTALWTQKTFSVYFASRSRGNAPWWLEHVF